MPDVGQAMIVLYRDEYMELFLPGYVIVLYSDLMHNRSRHSLVYNTV